MSSHESLCVCVRLLVQTSFYMISPSAADIPPPAGVVVGRPFRLPAGYKTPVDLEQGVPHPTLVVQQVTTLSHQVLLPLFHLFVSRRHPVRQPGPKLTIL